MNKPSEDKEFVAAPSPVEEVVKPPRARVEDAVDPDVESPRETMERKRDYLEGFLAKKPENLSPGEPGGELHDAGAELDAAGLSGEERERGDGVAAIGFRGPDAVVAELLGALDAFDRQFHLGARISDRQSQSHGVGPSPVTSGIVAPVERVGNGLSEFLSQVRSGPFLARRR